MILNLLVTPITIRKYGWTESPDQNTA